MAPNFYHVTRVSEIIELKPEPPMFIERFEEQKVKPNAVIQLAAKVTGNPQPEIAWFRYKYWFLHHEPLKF
jgi:hypothetical protein